MKQTREDFLKTIDECIEKPAFCVHAARAYVELGEFDKAIPVYEKQAEFFSDAKEFGKAGDVYRELYDTMTEKKHLTGMKRRTFAKKALDNYKQSGSWSYVDDALEIAHQKFKNEVDGLIDQKLDLLMEAGNYLYFDEARNTALKYERWFKLVDVSLRHYSQTAKIDKKFKDDDVLDMDTQKNLEMILTAVEKTGDWQRTAAQTNKYGFTEGTLEILSKVNLAKLTQDPHEMEQYLKTYHETLSTRIGEIRHYFKDDPATSFELGERMYDRNNAIMSAALSTMNKAGTEDDTTYLMNRLGHLMEDFTTARFRDYLELKCGLDKEKQDEMLKRMTGKDERIVVVQPHEAKRSGIIIPG